MSMPEERMSMHLGRAVAKREASHAAVALALKPVIADGRLACQASSPKNLQAGLRAGFFLLRWC